MSIKKTFSLLLLSLTIAIVTAQTDIIGVWKLAEMQHEGEAHPVNMLVVFNETGEINISGANVGTWSQNETENTFTISCPYLGVLEGKNTIETFNDTELTLKNVAGDINSFYKISLPKNKQLINKITGDWFFDKVEKNGKTDLVNQFVSFNKNGVFYFQEMVFGTWNYNKSRNTTTFDNEDFKGEYSNSFPNKNELVLKSDAYTMYFSKIDKEKIIKENKASGLIGTWEFKAVPYNWATTFISFKEPDVFTIIQKEDGMTSNSSGVWMFDKKQMSLKMLGLRSRDAFNGESKVLHIDGETLALKNNGTTYQGNKKAEETIKIERLTFTSADFYDETGDYKYYDDEQKLPWYNLSIYGIQNTYAGIDSLVYTYHILIENAAVFEKKVLTAKPDVNFEGNNAPGVTFEYIFNGYDRHTIPDDYELPIEKLNQYSSPLFPLKSDTFRVVGEEELTTPAGIFTCTVVEAIGQFDELQKIWLINDLPGIIAKIIKDKPGKFGHYHLYELQKINN